MYVLILDKAFGDNPEGSVIHLEDETLAKALMDSGVAHEATEEEMNGSEDEPADDVAEEAEPELVTNAVRDLTVKATKAVTKAAAKAVRDMSAKAVAPNMHVAEKVRDSRNDFKSLGHFAKAVVGAEYGDHNARRKLSPLSVKGQMTEGTAADGGYAVPQEWAASLFSKEFGQPDLLGMCQQYPMDNLILNIPAVNTNESVSSGVTAAFGTEANTISDSKLPFVNRTLQLERCQVLVNASEELLQDSPYALDSFLRYHAPVKMRLLTNKAILYTGGSYQANLISAAATVAVPRKTAGKVQYVDFANLFTRLWPESIDSAAYFVSPQVYASILTWTFPDSSGTFPATTITGGFGNVSGRPQLQVLGCPVHRILDLPAIGTKGDVVLADMNAVAAGSRALDAAFSPHLYFDKYIRSFRFVLRLSTTALWNSAYTPADGATLSPYAALDVASS